jgi:hypothetical protein
MSAHLSACPFCAEEIPEQAAVCRACHRDIAIPAPLEAEHLELSLKRDALRAELDRARLADRRWLGRTGDKCCGGLIVVTQPQALLP